MQELRRSPRLAAKRAKQAEELLAQQPQEQSNASCIDLLIALACTLLVVACLV
jgi:hypothetical protein